LKVVAVELGRASMVARRGVVEDVGAARLAELVDLELRKLVVARREAVLGGLSQRTSRVLGQVASLESGQTTYDAALVAAELASIAGSLRLLGLVLGREAA
jgi:hypothetical protein